VTDCADSIARVVLVLVVRVAGLALLLARAEVGGDGKTPGPPGQRRSEILRPGQLGFIRLPGSLRKDS
jgi:hypothetical protein